MNYLNAQYDFNDPALVSYLDEFSLWSAPFGLKLLECVRMKSGLKVLDIGFGNGFPLIELAQRLGNSSNVFGIDLWDAAIVRTNQKIAYFGLSNVEVKHAAAEEIPFPDEYFDLIVSNNGLNNVDDLDRSLSECFRVSKPGAQMVITMNLPDTFTEFYTIFRNTLIELKAEQYLTEIDRHIFHKRKPLDYLEEKLIHHGFSTHQKHIESFRYHFTDGTALLNYAFFKVCFLDGWKGCIPEHLHESVFVQLETNLNRYASNHQGIALSVPFVCFDLIKIK